MSLDFYLELEEIEAQCVCPCCDNIHIRKYSPDIFHDNLTHNLGKMADACDLYRYLWRPDENNIEYAHQLITPLTLGIQRLISDPEVYKKYNPKNGWGSYDGFLLFCNKLLEKCIQFPKAKVSVWR